MKKIFFISFILIIQNVVSQQLPFYNQYFWNDYLINPANTGSNKSSAIQISYRNQWTEFIGAPKTYTIGGYTFFKKQKIGLGGILFQDETGGAFSQTGMIINCNYMLVLNKQSELFLGLGSIINQYAFNGTQITMTQSDPQMNYARKELKTDFNFGVQYLYKKNLRIGIAVNQLLESKFNNLNLNISDKDQLNRLIRHYNIAISHKLKFQDNYIEPYLLVRSIMITPPQFQIGARIMNKQHFYLGLSFRTNDAIIFNLGIETKKLLIGYSFDFTTSNIKSSSSGSHELMLGYRLPTDKKR